MDSWDSLLRVFSPQRYLMVSHRSLSDQKSLQFHGLSSVFCRSQLCNSLDGPHSSSYFQVFQSLFQPFGDSIVWPRFGYLFVSQNLRGVCLFHSLGQILGCAYTICSYDQTSTFTIISRLLCPSNRSLSYTPSVLIYCIRLLCDRSFRLFQYLN